MVHAETGRLDDFLGRASALFALGDLRSHGRVSRYYLLASGLGFRLDLRALLLILLRPGSEESHLVTHGIAPSVNSGSRPPHAAVCNVSVPLAQKSGVPSSA